MLDEAAINHRPTHFIHSLLIFFIVYGIANVASALVSSIPMMIYLLRADAFWELLTGVMDNTITEEAMDLLLTQIINNSPWWVTLCSLIASGGAFIGATIIYCKFIEKRKISTLGLRKTKYALEYGMGSLIGIAMYSLTLGVALACGSVSFVGGATFSFPIILFLIAFVIQGAGEELLVRGYLMTTVARDYKVGLALVFSSAVFSIIHGANAGISAVALINILLFGAFEGIYILKRGDIIGACAIHTMWNFTQGCVFGSSVSGISGMPSIFHIAPNPDMTAANGGAFGLEGGFSATIVLLISIGLVLLLTPKRSELPEYEILRMEYDENEIEM